jgi:enamine deaminase RidA (YjgF/YER057c/UK114 family)
MPRQKNSPKVKYLSKSFDLKLFKFVFMNFVIAEESFEEPLARVLKEIDGTVGLHHIVRQAFFASSSAGKEKLFTVMRDCFPKALPATSFIPQPLCTGEHLGAELWAFLPSSDADRIDQISHNVSVAEIENVQWAFISGIESFNAAFLNEKVDQGLHEIARLLNAHGFEFNHVIRTWYYVGDILGAEHGTPRYDRMNRARNDFYGTVWGDRSLYPASTGIGMSSNGFVLDGTAIHGDRNQVSITRITNPLQTNPSNYMINKPTEAKPAFCRAIAVNLSDYGIIFVSGTASIRDSGVVFEEDITKQTQTTIENIAYLIGEDNLAQRYPFSKGASLQDIQQIRVYVKRPRDYPLVKQMCEQAFGGIPQLYCLANICRPSLLMEIEAVAIVEE